MNKQLKDLAARLTKLRRQEERDDISDETFQNRLHDIQCELEGLAKDDPKPAKPEPKMTPCKGCGTFDFKQRYHAICDSEGYLDESGYFTATNTDVDEITQIHDFECVSCGKTVEDPDDEESEGDDE